MGSVTIRFLAGISIYASLLIFSVYVHDYGVGRYQAYMCGFTARGVGIGMATHSARYLFLLTNIFVFIIPNLYGKLTVITAAVIFMLWYFLPEHPVRAIAYSGFTGCMSIFALVVRAGIERLFSRR